jgi:hypothetical protein
MHENSVHHIRKIDIARFEQGKRRCGASSEQGLSRSDGARFLTRHLLLALT